MPTNRPMIRKTCQDLVYMTEERRSAPSSKTSAGVPPKASRCWWVPSQSKKSSGFPADQSGHRAQGAERQIPRHGSGYRCGSRPERCGNHRHQLAAAVVPISCWVAAGRPKWRCWKSRPKSRSKPSKRLWKVRHDAVLAAGGLHIIGTERHESRAVSITSCAAVRSSGRCRSSSRFYDG